MRHHAARAAAVPLARPAQPDFRAAGLLLYVVAGAIVIVVSVQPVTLWLADGTSDLTIETVARLLIATAIILLAALGLYVRGDRAGPGLRGGPVVRTAPAAGLLAVMIALGVAWAGGHAAPQPHGGVTDLPVFITGSALVLLGVVSEELLLRGLLQPALIRAWGPGSGVIVTAAAFVLIHLVGGWGHPVSLLNILLAGIWFGLLAVRSGGLLAPILAHFAYNWAEEMLFGASPNPGFGVYGSILDIDIAGPAISGGSAEGLNASIAITIILVAFIITLLSAGRRHLHAGDGAETA